MSVNLQMSPIPLGSFAVRIWVDGRDYGDDIDTVLVLENRGDQICEIAMAHGFLTEEMLIQLGFQAFDKGFKGFTFKMPRSMPQKRFDKVMVFSQLVGTDENFYHFYVDLAEQVPMYRRGAS